MSTLNFNFRDGELDKAFQMIVSEGYNLIRCSLTGIEYGTIADDEIRNCLRLELRREPFADADRLVDDWTMRYYVMCSSPAPAFRVIKSHNHLLRFMKSDPRGPASLFCYVAGRLFFEALPREKDVDSFANRAARTQFLVDLHKRLDSLPEDWHNSLTPADEEITASSEAIRILNTAVNTEPTIEEESKNAQKCLESLLRLDGIHNIRKVMYSAQIRADLVEYRDSDIKTFHDLFSLLGRLEADSIIKMQKERSTPEGNAMLFTSALDAISRAGHRIESVAKNFERTMQKGQAESKLRETFNQLRALGVGSEGFDLDDSNKEKKLLEIMASANREMNVVSFGEKRLDTLTRQFSHGHEKGNTKVRRGISAVVGLLEAGIKNPELLKQAQAAVKAGVISKMPGEKKKTSTPSKAKTDLGKAQAFNRDTAANILGGADGLAALFAKIDVSKLNKK